MWAKNISHLRDMEPSRRLPIWWHKLDAAETVSYGTEIAEFVNTDFDSDAKFTNAIHSKRPAEGTTEPGYSFYINPNVVPMGEFTMGFWIKNKGQQYILSEEYSSKTDGNLDSPNLTYTPGLNLAVVKDFDYLCEIQFGNDDLNDYFQTLFAVAIGDTIFWSDTNGQTDAITKMEFKCSVGATEGWTYFAPNTFDGVQQFNFSKTADDA